MRASRPFGLFFVLRKVQEIMAFNVCDPGQPTDNRKLLPGPGYRLALRQPFVTTGIIFPKLSYHRFELTDLAVEITNITPYLGRTP